MAILNHDDASQQPSLDKARHVKYWTRCLKTLLPHQYTSNDSNRMYLAFFIIGALDLLGSLDSVPSKDEREDYVNWIYHCQHPDGGFRMWPGTDFGAKASKDNALWDPANVPATYFALTLLLILDDDFKRVKRRETLLWLLRMQRPDGSFGETLVNGTIEGGRDPRFGYCAAGIRYILRGPVEGAITVDGQSMDDVDVDAFVGCVRLAEEYEGGLADEPFHEPHAGYTFCSLGALALLGRLNTQGPPSTKPLNAPTDPQHVISWLAYRQTDLTDPDGSIDSEFAGKPDADGTHKPGDRGASNEPAHQHRDCAAGSIFDLLVDGAGMNGRTNKVADTCYAFWVGASLHVMQCPMVYDHDAVRRYLLGKTQHPVLGGFGKFPNDLPDLLHAYLGLAALSLAGSEEVKDLDARMCISKSASSRLPKLWKSWRLDVA